jgi:cobalt-zinc-cadmium efflux system outer membrane protein
MHNPELAAFTWEVRAMEARTLQAGLAPNPEIGVEFEDFAGSGDLQGIDGAEVTVALSQVIELAGKRQKRTRVAALERDLTAWDYEATRLDVLTRVTQAFVAVLSAQERLAVDTELARLAEQVLQGAEARVKAGKVPPIEATRTRVALSTSRMALGRTQRALTAAKARLVATWGGTHPAFEKAVGDLESLQAIPSAEALAERIEQNPDIARWATVMAQRQAAITLEEAKRIPDPTLGGGFRYFNETQDQAFLFLVSTPLPIFDRNQGNLLEARYQSAKADEERRMAAIGVRTALAESYAELAAAFAESRALRDEILPGAERAFETASTGYRQGKFQFLDVLDAQRTLVEVRGQYIEVLASYHQAVAALERLIGEPLNALTQSSSQP